MKFKTIKRIVNGVLIVVVIFLGSQYIKIKFQKQDVRQVYQKEINEKLIIKKLHDESKLVTLSGEIHKTFGKQISIFNTKHQWLYNLGAKKYIVTMNGKYQLGIDLNKIHLDDIHTIKNEIYIKLPSVELAGLDLPFEKMKVVNESGIFVSEYSTNEIKSIHIAAKKEIVKELESDVVSKEKALSNAEEVLRSLLVGVDKGYKVRFVN